MLPVKLLPKNMLPLKLLPGDNFFYNYCNYFNPILYNNGN